MSIAIAKQLKIGDVFYESSYGSELEATVTEAVTTTVDKDSRTQYRWKAETSAGHEISYLITEGYEHYGPRITLTPMYS